MLPQVHVVRLVAADAPAQAEVVRSGSVPWNAIGQPALAAPVGSDEHGLPLAVQLAGRAGDEALLLSLASEIEASQPVPRWAATADTEQQR